MKNKFEPYYLMAILTGWSLFGGLIVIFLPESMQKRHHRDRGGGGGDESEATLNN